MYSCGVDIGCTLSRDVEDSEIHAEIEISFERHKATVTMISEAISVEFFVEYFMYVVQRLLGLFPEGLRQELSQWNIWEPKHSLLIAAILAIIILILVVLVKKCAKRVQAQDKIKAVKELVAPGAGPRFRKRDRIEFMSRRALRNAKAVGSYIRGGQGRKRRDMAKLMKRVFQSKESPDLQSQMLRPDLPMDFLEEEKSHDGNAGESSLPEAFVLVLKNLRVFGHFDSAILMEVMKYMEQVKLRKNETLFDIGDLDSHLYIVESGVISVTYDIDAQSESNRHNVMELREVKPGEPVVSLLSFIEYLGGRRKKYKTVAAKAGVDNTVVIKFAFECFREAFAKYPDSLSDVIQVIMVRLHRVTLLALHQYLGLGTELMSEKNRGVSEKDDGQMLAIEHESSAMREAVELADPSRLLQDISTLNNQNLRDLASKLFKHHLGLTDEPNLTDEDEQFFKDIGLTTCEAGQILVEEESTDRNYLIVVLTGHILVSQKQIDENEKKKVNEVHKAYPGGFLGQLQILTCEPSFFTYTAEEESLVGVASGRSVRQLMRRHPKAALALAMSVIDHLSPYLRSMDFALEWTLVESGKALYKQDSKAESTFVVLSGRLRSVIIRPDGKREMVGEYGKGELTGIVEMLMKTPRSTTVIAVRDTEVAKLPAGLIDLIKLRFPNVLMRLIQLLGEKLQQSWSQSPRSVAAMSPSQMQHSPLSNFSTVAIVSLSPDIPINAFTFELLHALNQIEPSIRLTRSYVLNILGEDAFDKSSDFRLSSWLANQEDKNRIVIYQCDSEFSSWTRLCVRHADVIFFVANPSGSTSVSSLEEMLENYSRRTRKDMIFLHTEETKCPTNTAQWLKNRVWINSHYHIKANNRIFFKKRVDKIETMYKKILEGPPPNIHSDFSRLARMITGNPVGLVLGGGGARGISHVGMIRAILEAGIPIDFVAGVSIGSFIGGLWCQERSITEMTVKARAFSAKMSHFWRQVFDLTYPITSYFTGNSFNAALEEAFEDRDIRDLWLPYFVITTDITDSSMRIHDYGSLWRYVRSSMSLAGYLPPLCDPHDGHLLLDGGYVNNLPADVMRLRGAKHVLAIDVGAQDDIDFTNYGDSLSGFQVLFRKWSPFHSRLNVPNQADIQSRLAYVSCASKLENVKRADYCDYIRPPIDKFTTLQFGAFDEIRDVGYFHGKTYFAGLRKAGLLRQLSGTKAQQHPITDGYVSFGEEFDNEDEIEEILEDEEGGQLGHFSLPRRRKASTKKKSKGETL